jgi:quercetin dioxygenase-like cupin family protein
MPAMRTVSKMRRATPIAGLALGLGILLLGCSDSPSSDAAATTTTTSAEVTSTKPESSLLLDKQAQTVLDQLLTYPSVGQAQVSSAVLTFAPGATTGLHRHDAPLYVYVLEGTITVTYDGDVVKEYSAGQAILEAVGTAHNGTNLTDAPVKLLVVNMGAEGVANTVAL